MLNPVFNQPSALSFLNMNTFTPVSQMLPPELSLMGSLNAGSLPGFDSAWGLPIPQPTSNSGNLLSMLTTLIVFSKLFGHSDSARPVARTGNGTVAPQPVAKPNTPPTVPLDPNDKSILDQNNLSLSQGATRAIQANPQLARDIIEQELIRAAGTSTPNAIIKKILNVDIKTGFSEERKTLMAFQIYQDVLDQLTRNTLNSLQLGNVKQTLPSKTVIDRGGVVLSQSIRDAIVADQANANSIIRKELESLTGTNKLPDILAKVIGVKNLDGGGDQFANELFGYLTTDLIKRSKA